MTEREAFEFEDKKKKILARCGYRCKWCGGQATDLAHRAARTADNALIAGKLYFDTIGLIYPSRRAVMRQGYRILNHPMNLDATCNRCNPKSNIGHQREVARGHIVKIISYGREDGEWE